MKPMTQSPSDFSLCSLSRRLGCVYEVIFANQVWIVLLLEEMFMATKEMARVCEYTGHFLGILATRR